MDDCVANSPEDITKEILLRCPVKSLLRFKCVCRSWYAFIKSPEFVLQHLKNHSSPRLLTYTIGTPDDDDGHDSRFISLISEENPQTFVGMTKLIGYVDGLFLMYRENSSVISCALWNPATREVRPLHLPLLLPEPIIHDAHVFGFGLDPLTNDYKVVYFHHNHWSEYAAAVYSCSRDSWRIFKPNEPLPFCTKLRNTFGTAYLNGAYYWLLKGGYRCYYTIVLFNFGSEMFEEIDGPDHHSVYTFVLGLMLIDDSIAILNYNPRSMFDYDIWVLTQPGVWNKIVTFHCFTEIKSCYDSCLILTTEASELISYNVRTNETRHLGFQHPGLRKDAVHGGCGVYCYKESLVTIKRQEDGELEN